MLTHSTAQRLNVFIHALFSKKNSKYEPEGKWSLCGQVHEEKILYFSQLFHLLRWSFLLTIPPHHHPTNTLYFTGFSLVIISPTTKML